MEKDIIIFTDLDKMRNVTKPAVRVNIAVRVPDENMPQITKSAVIPKK